MAVTIIKIGGKLAIAGGAIFYTLDKGVWNMNPDSPKLINEVKERVLPETKEYINKIPSKTDAFDAIKSYWNSGVEKTFRGVSVAPEFVTSSITKYSGTALSEFAKKIKP